MKFNRHTYGDSDQRLALCKMVDKFAEEMKSKLILKLEQGYEGWDDPDWSLKGDDGVIDKLRRHIDKGDPIDVANFALFWWNKIESHG